MSGPETTIRRLDTRHLPWADRNVIARWLGCGSPDALRVIEQDGTAAILRFSNYGTALAAEIRLQQHGYHAEPAGDNPDGYGYAVRVIECERHPPTREPH